jgi:phosphatidylglycerol:prolipoprotein diacylglycerol transferase
MMMKKCEKECKPCKVKQKIEQFKETKVGQFIMRVPEVVIGPLMMLWVFILIVIATRGLGLIPQTEVFKIGSISVQWYAAFILTGIIFAAIYGYYEFPKIGISRDTLTDGLLVIVPLSILGTRLYYVIFDSQSTYRTLMDVLDLTDGGLAIHGGIITAIISVFVFAKIKKTRVWYFLDVLVIGFLIGQTIGRWGNFINQEAYGPAVENSWIFHNLVPKFVKINMEIRGITYHPTFLYESFLNFIFLVFLLVIRKFKVLKVGDSLGLYLIYYGFIRGVIIEPLRQDPLYIGTLKVNIWLSLILFVGGGILFLVLKYIFVKNLPYYYDLAITDKLYLKGLEGREYKRKLKEEKRKLKEERIKAEQEKYQVPDEEIIAELNKMEANRKKDESND